MNNMFNLMKLNKMKRLIAILMLVLTGMTAVAQTSVWDGNRALWTRGEGTENNPYLIESAAHLAYLAYMVNKGFETYGLHFRLTTDIDLNGSEDQQWIPIGLGNRWFNEDGCDRGDQSGYPFSPNTLFRGHFDGGEHSVSNIYVDNESYYAGLFGSAVGIDSDHPAVIENVFVTSGYIKGTNAGGIVGYGSNTLVSRCWNGASVEGVYCGGIVGHNAFKVYNCYNVGDVNGTSSAGGIVGTFRAYEIVECYNEGNVTGRSAGGIMGEWMQSGTISNCYNSGGVTAVGDNSPQTSAGGLVGATAMGTRSISNCYSIGTVQSDNNLGCLVGYGVGSVEIENCYYLTSTCTESEYGEPKDEDYMRSQEFVDLLNGRDGELVWGLDVNNINDGFPILLEVNTLAISEQLETPFEVYPNPAQGCFTVEGTGRMIVSSLLGQVVMVKEIDGPTTVSLPQGMYFVKLGGATRKVVVE